MSPIDSEHVPVHQPDTRKSEPDREPLSPLRGGLTREAAHAEMNRFRGVAEYETRKLFGQRSALRQAVEPAQSAESQRRSEEERTGNN
jgi:hypothetical protein